MLLEIYSEPLFWLFPVAGSAISMVAFLVFSVAAFAQLVVGHLVDNHSVRTVFAFVALLQAVFLALMMQLDGLAALIVAISSRLSLPLRKISLLASPE